MVNGIASSFNACTTLDSPEKVHWCSTKVNEDGVHVYGNWGDCSPECPIEGKSEMN